MKWSIPANTFLLGEYAAIEGAPALVLTTSPCFELTLSHTAGLQGIHPESPAGRWWLKNGPVDMGLQWHDPYQGCGGMGASSAQFLGAYLASMLVQKKLLDQQEMLNAYLQCAYNGQGLRPSGYDVLAQSLSGCVYIDKRQDLCQTHPWPFQDIGFLLLHTGKKLATHHHLQTMVLPNQINQLAAIVEIAKTAFELVDSQRLVDAVNAYHQELAYLKLVADHSLQHLAFFKKQTDILAAKGCGAMGADVLLLLMPKGSQVSMSHQMLAMGWKILATSADLYVGPSLIQKNPAKRLEI